MLEEKGISSVVSTILLILITISLTATVSIYLNDITFTDNPNTTLNLTFNDEKENLKITNRKGDSLKMNEIILRSENIEEKITEENKILQVGESYKISLSNSELLNQEKRINLVYQEEFVIGSFKIY